jgi:release factor glutamine methyltransferase
MIKNRTLLSHYRQHLEAIYPSEESAEIVYRLAERYFQINRTELLLILDEEEYPGLADFLTVGTHRLLCHEPVQYLLGEVEFYGCTIKLNPSVLIPRPETEEMVDIIVKEWKGRTPQVLDFGTGSGCIAISLARALPGSTVRAVDISAEALVVARYNAGLNDADVDIVQADMRTYTDSHRYDIIVSNPPYVMNSEKAQMRDNVLDYEPHLALFVDDDAPLEFYIPVANFAERSLAAGGAVYLEVNQQLGHQTAELFASRGMSVEVRQDFFGVDRFVIARWK